MKGTRIFLERTNFGRFINLHMAVQNASYAWAVAQPVTFIVAEEGVDDGSPMMQFTPDQAQCLMDELWTVGLRPTQGKQSDGQMGATTKHLEDMRAIVSALAKVQLP